MGPVPFCTCASAAVITKYAGQAVRGVHIVCAQHVGGGARLLVVAVLIAYTVIGVVLDHAVLLVVAEPAFLVRAVGDGVLVGVTARHIRDLAYPVPGVVGHCLGVIGDKACGVVNGRDGAEGGVAVFCHTIASFLIFS